MYCRRMSVMRDIRRAKGLTLVQLAEILGTSHGYLSDVERGEMEPSLPMLKQIAAALGADPADLLAVKAPDRIARKIASLDPEQAALAESYVDFLLAERTKGK